MKTPEPSETQNDKDYCNYLSGHSTGPVGFLLLMVGLDAVYKALERGDQMTPREKLMDYLESVEPSCLLMAINAILGSLAVQCTEDQLDVAIKTAKGLLYEKEGL